MIWGKRDIAQLELISATEMQRRTFNAYLPGETTHAEVAKRFGVGRTAITMRLTRLRIHLGISRAPTRRPQRKTPARFIQLSMFDAA